MKILALEASNFKRISVVRIAPDGNLVQITGKNGQGKTSVLDSIYVALAGMAGFKEQTKPIRKGQQKATIKLDLGEYVVTRTFHEAKGSGNLTTQLEVTNKEGFTAPEPQKMLDALLSSLAFDPLSFDRAKPREQFDMVRSLVSGFDFDANAEKRKKAFENRTTVNRQAKEAEAAAASVAVSVDLPDAPIDEAALTKALADAGAVNADIEKRRNNRDAAKAIISDLRLKIELLDSNLEGTYGKIGAGYDSLIAEVDEEMKRLVEKRERLVNSREADLNQAREDVAKAKKDGETRVAEIQSKLDAAPELPDPVDTEALATELTRARAVNADIRKREERDGHLTRLKGLVDRSKALTAEIEAADKAKAAAVSAASLPVEGLTFGDDEILLDGLPLTQASDAARLRTSCAIGMALNPKLRILRVRDGSLLDEDGLKLLAAMADEHDTQVWVERVGSGGEGGFVLVDGHLAGVEPPAEAAEEGADA